MTPEETTNYTQPEPIATIGEITDSQLTPEERKAAWEQSMDYIRNQEPLNRVYDNSDFAQGLAQGRLLERMAIRIAVQNEIARLKEVDPENAEFIKGAYASLKVV